MFNHVSPQEVAAVLSVLSLSKEQRDSALKNAASFTLCVFIGATTGLLAGTLDAMGDADRLKIAEAKLVYESQNNLSNKQTLAVAQEEVNVRRQDAASNNEVPLATVVLGALGGFLYAVSSKTRSQ